MTTEVDRPIVDDAGWTPDDAETLARAAGIGPLSDRHWKVIALCREETARRRTLPDLARMASLSALDAAVLQRLFPGNTMETIARIAGLLPPTLGS